MLINLHVKNFALIEEADVDFGQGLNILTGETGAGKSILIDAVNAALGGRLRGEMIRSGCESAYIELTFSVPEEAKQDQLRELGIDMEYDCITVSRRIFPRRSVHKINGETVGSSLIRQATLLLMDIHGQHEHQSLMNRSRHLEVLDRFGGEALESGLAVVSRTYHEYISAREEADSFDADPVSRERQRDFLLFEVEEIRAAGLRPGETEELETAYRRMQNSQRICDGLYAASASLEGGGRDGVSDRVSAAARELHGLLKYDEGLEDLAEQLAQIEDLLGSFARELEDYREEMVFDPEAFREMEERLDLLHHLESKYGGSYEAIQASLQRREEELASLEDYDLRREEALHRLEEARAAYKEACRQLSRLREKTAPVLREVLEDSIRELNFNHVDFRIDLREAEHPGRLGADEVEFLISLNPGEAPRPLGQVASGGELSRIMLAIKTVLSDKDDIPSLIFDEIDTGISGRTAQKVSEKLSLIGRHRQVLCITHLPQIASMADRHYEIRKQQEENHTVTQVRLLSEEESIGELARLLGGAQITEAVFRNAVEMKLLAAQYRQGS